MEWMRGWSSVFGEILFQRITASHLQNPLPLPPVNDLTCIVTGSTSGIGRETARFFSSSRLSSYASSFDFRFTTNCEFEDCWLIPQWSCFHFGIPLKSSKLCSSFASLFAGSLQRLVLMLWWLWGTQRQLRSSFSNGRTSGLVEVSHLISRYNLIVSYDIYIL